MNMTEPTQAELDAAIAAERAKLGANVDARVKAVQDFLVASAGEDAGRAIAAGPVTASQIQGFERLMSDFRSRSAAPSPSAAAPRDNRAADDGRVGEEQYSKMSNAERLDYARRMSR